MRLNKIQIEEIATRMVQRKVSAYAGRFTICNVLGVEDKKITADNERKILTRFWRKVLVEPGTRYSTLDKMYCEAQLNLSGKADIEDLLA